MCVILIMQTHKSDKLVRKAAFPQRVCPGVSSRKRGNFCSYVEVDPHALCISCRGHDCSRDAECCSWSAEQWGKFEGGKRYRRKAAKASSEGYAPPTVPLVANPSSFFSLSRQSSPSSCLSFVFFALFVEHGTTGGRQDDLLLEASPR